MSCLRCEGCSEIIDTDYDVEAYVRFTDGRERWLCEGCRNDLEFNDDGKAIHDAEEERLMPGFAAWIASGGTKD